MKTKVICARCICDSTIPGFDPNGAGNSQCNYCDMHDALEAQHKVNPQTLKELFTVVRSERKKPTDYDGVVGISGGCDSSYLLHLLRDNGIRVVAVNYNNGWDTPVARNNIMVMCKALGVPLHEVVTEPGDAEDVWKAFLRSGLPDVEAPTDIALTRVLYDAARKFKVKYIFDGHSFRTEGVAPIGLSYMDGKYIRSVWDDYNPVRKVKPPYPLPNLYFTRWMFDMLFHGFKRPRCLYYIDYDKDKVKALLSKTYGWQDYGLHHAENELTTWFGYVYRPKRLKVDGRKISLSAYVRTGKMTRAEALKIVADPPAIPTYATTEYIAARLGMATTILQAYMRAPIANRAEVPSYRKLFKSLKPIFYLMHKAGRIPTTFYRKYCD
jgi:hypothetical protein